MSSSWPAIELRDVIKLDLDKVEIDPAATYDMVGVLSFGKGLFHREPVLGANTSYKFFLRLKANHLVMSQLFGWEGALALSSSEFAGRFLSPQFPTFLCDERKLDRNYLGWYIRMPVFWEDLGKRTKGMGDRRRTLNPESLLGCEIPFPPLSDQRRVVAKIDELAAKIKEAHTLRQRAVEEVEALVISVHIELAGNRKRKLSDILTLDEDEVAIKPTGEYPQVGIKSFGVGLFAKPSISGTETTYRTFNRLYEGAFVLSQVKGWEGAVDVCGSELAGWFVSPEYRTFRCIPGEGLPGYLAALIRTKWFWSHLQDATRGVGARRERTRPEQFLAIEIPMPDVERQKLGETLFAEVGELKRLQADTAAELDALLPSILDKAFKGEL
jgi:type I restriction enzyme S subunit